MARPSKLTDAQWEKIGKRLLDGESASSLAREFGVGKATISERFANRLKTVKEAANQIVAAESTLGKLNVSEQIAARSLADRLKAISGHLAGAAEFGAATAHRLAGIANAKLQQVDDSQPLSEESRTALTDVAALSKMANEASQIGMNLLKANQEAVDEANRRDAAQDSKPKGIAVRLIPAKAPA